MALRSAVISLVSKRNIPGTGDDNTQMVILFIVAGVALVLLAATFVFFFIMRRREDKKKSMEAFDAVSTTGGAGPAEDGDENGEQV